MTISLAHLSVDLLRVVEELFGVLETVNDVEGVADVAAD
jgi:hypothetical protein